MRYFPSSLGFAPDLLLILIRNMHPDILVFYMDVILESPTIVSKIFHSPCTEDNALESTCFHVHQEETILVKKCIA